jgi:hypothetical protein
MRRGDRLRGLALPATASAIQLYSGSSPVPTGTEIRATTIGTSISLVNSSGVPVINCTSGLITGTLTANPNPSFGFVRISDVSNVYSGTGSSGRCTSPYTPDVTVYVAAGTSGMCLDGGTVWPSGSRLHSCIWPNNGYTATRLRTMQANGISCDYASGTYEDLGQKFTANMANEPQVLTESGQARTAPVKEGCYTGPLYFRTNALSTPGPLQYALKTAAGANVHIQ